MTVMRNGLILVALVATAWPAWSVAQAQQSTTDRQAGAATLGQRDRAMILPSEAHVLRHKFSVPLEQLVEPVRLADLRNALASPPAAPRIAPAMPAPAAAPATTPGPTESTSLDAASGSREPLDDPFADDPQPRPEGKIPSGKLLGIVGRALLESVPVPSLEGLRERIPGLPPAPAAASPDAGAQETSAGSEDADFAPAEDDPFAEPAAESTPAEESEPASEEQEDPFGGF